jgi:hypothetical protein
MLYGQYYNHHTPLLVPSLYRVTQLEIVRNYIRHSFSPVPFALQHHGSKEAQSPAAV